jgi:AcrR family transcriptional regulator
MRDRCQGLSEQPRKAKYRMGKRAEAVDENRQRIVEAAVRLHGTVGPAQTTIAGIAREAGVTRVTVYRHFPDEQAIYAACSAHWLAQQLLPDPEAWALEEDPVERLRFGLADLYRFYREGEPMLTRVYRDKAHIAPERSEALDARDAYFRDVLGAGLDRRLVAHAVKFWTWRSLCVEEGLTNAEAVDAMVHLATMPTRAD